LTRFQNDSELGHVSSSLFEETPASGLPVSAAPGSNGLGAFSFGVLANGKDNSSCFINTVFK